MAYLRMLQGKLRIVALGWLSVWALFFLVTDAIGDLHYFDFAILFVVFAPGAGLLWLLEWLRRWNKDEHAPSTKPLYIASVVWLWLAGVVILVTGFDRFDFTSILIIAGPAIALALLPEWIERGMLPDWIEERIPPDWLEWSEDGPEPPTTYQV